MVFSIRENGCNCEREARQEYLELERKVFFKLIWIPIENYNLEKMETFILDSEVKAEKLRKTRYKEREEHIRESYEQYLQWLEYYNPELTLESQLRMFYKVRFLGKRVKYTECVDSNPLIKYWINLLAFLNCKNLDYRNVMLPKIDWIERLFTSDEKLKQITEKFFVELERKINDQKDENI